VANAGLDQQRAQLALEISGPESVGLRKVKEFSRDIRIAFQLCKTG
jgi:hypothetical protein